MLKTYIFAGDDHNGALKESTAQFENDPNYVIIRPRTGETFAQAVDRANMPRGSNVLLFCHGSEKGSFSWQQDKPLVSYSNAFTAMPAGINSINLACCFGGSAITAEHMKHAPENCAVISGVTGQTPGIGGSVAKERFDESRHLTKPVDLYLESLDNLDPKTYEECATRWNKESGSHYITNPMKAMPTIIGIGGKEPKALNAMNVLVAITMPEKDPVKNGFNAHENELFDNIDDKKMDKAVKRVQARFESKGWIEDGARLIGQDDITKVAEKLRNHEKPKGPEEYKIALALCASYADECGVLKRKTIENTVSHIASILDGASHNGSKPHAEHQTSQRPDMSVRHTGGMGTKSESINSKYGDGHSYHVSHSQTGHFEYISTNTYDGIRQTEVNISKDEKVSIRVMDAHGSTHHYMLDDSKLGNNYIETLQNALKGTFTGAEQEKFEKVQQLIGKSMEDGSMNSQERISVINAVNDLNKESQKGR